MSPTQYLSALKRCGAELETLVSAPPKTIACAGR